METARPCRRSFKCLVEQELGQFPLFIIYAFLEWVLILILFVNGSLALLANEFARFFEMRMPCLFCTRIDNILVTQARDFYRNDAVCESHKKELSSMAYCHLHGKLSDIEGMCEGCLLSFATEEESDSGCMYKSLVRILLKDLECFVQDDSHVRSVLLSSRNKEDNELFENKNREGKCSCCHESPRMSSCSIVLAHEALRKSTPITKVPTPSPRAQPAMIFGEEMPNLLLPHIRYTEIKDSDIISNDAGGNPNTPGTREVDEDKAASLPLLTGVEDMANALKTPPFSRVNWFFRIPLSESANNSPRWGTRTLRKFPLERVSSTLESVDGHVMTDPADRNSIVSHLTRQVKLDRKSLVELYLELDVERSASAVAANNAMAMITRLQAEKAAVQMEALQYQRMMDEQAEYDQEAFQETNNRLTEREEELKSLQIELNAYRVKFRYLENEGLAYSNDKKYKDFEERKKQINSISNFGSESRNASPHSVGEDDDLISLPAENQFADLNYIGTFY